MTRGRLLIVAAALLLTAALQGCLADVPDGRTPKAVRHGECAPPTAPKEAGSAMAGLPLAIDILNDRYEDALLCVYLDNHTLLEGWARESDIAPNVQHVGAVTLPSPSVHVRVEDKRDGLTHEDTIALEAENYLTIHIIDGRIQFNLNHQVFGWD